MSQDSVSAEKSPSSEHVDESANPIERFRRYSKGVRLEMRQVSWPSWKEVRSTTLVVLFFTFAMTAFVAAVNWIGAFFYRLLVER